MKALKVLAFIVLLVSAAAQAGDDTAALLAQVRQRLQTAPVLQGRFEQRKQIKSFKNPLVSHGEFLVAQGQGIAWHTLTPFESTLIVTRNRLKSVQADGTVSTQLDAQKEPGLRAVNTLLFALMAADLDALAQRFRITGAVKDEGWNLTLTPRDAALALWLARIELQGQRLVTSARLVEARGDESLILFSAQSVADTLTPAQAKAFE